MNKCIIFLLTVFSFFSIQSLQAQVKDTQIKNTVPVIRNNAVAGNNQKDSIAKKRKADSLSRINLARKTAHIRDSIKNKKRLDSLALFQMNVPADSTKFQNVLRDTKRIQISSPAARAQREDFISDSLKNDSINQSDEARKISAPVNAKYQTNITHQLLLQNKFINIKQAPVYFLQQERKVNGKEILFYSICLLILFLGLFKTFFPGYFNNIFRVFFNTSLRQSQLTDQLLQAKLPSLILNILFILSSGLYIWLLFTHLSPHIDVSSRVLLAICMGAVAVIYLVKYVVIKFMGWVSGIQYATNNYIFIIFLVNKIIGILLIPFIILLAFSNPAWISTVVTISFLLLGLFFLARYIKSYGSLDRKLRLNPFHFVIYIIGAEILPLLILYKISVDYLF